VPVQVANQTNGTVCFLYVSPCSSNAWGDDILGQAVLPSGQSVTVNIQPGCWDFRADDCDGNALATQMRAQVAGPSQWVLQGNVAPGPGPGPGPVPVPTGPMANLTVTNQTGQEIFFMFMSPCEQASWGPDLLGDSTLPNGASVTVQAPLGCMDFQALDRNRNPITPPDTRFEVAGDAPVILQ
jgi:hypothetical protein